jgi:Tol biopolymer transport system component
MFVSYPKGEISHFTNDLTNYDACCLAVTRDGDSLVALQNTVSSDVWVAKEDGSQSRRVTTGEALGLGLDWTGNRIAAQSSAFQWSLMNPDGSNRVPLMNDGDPHFQLSACSDGKHVIYDSWHDGSISLWRSAADGSNPLKLASLAVVGASLCAPDSKSVVYGADGAIWRVSIDGGKAEKLDLPFSQLAYSRDGKLLFYTSQKIEGGVMKSNFVVLPAGGGAPLYTVQIPYGARSARFTPDGKAIAFILSRNRAANIWEQPLSGGSPVQLTKFTTGNMFAFSWSQDGKQLAFSSGQNKTDVVMMSGFH